MKFRAVDPTYIEHAKGELRDLGFHEPTPREAAVFVHCVEWWQVVARREHHRGRQSGIVLGALLGVVLVAGIVVGWLLMAPVDSGPKLVTQRKTCVSRGNDSAFGLASNPWKMCRFRGVGR